MALKKIPKITNKQIAEKGVQSLADRPNLTAQYGASGLSPAQLKLWFDKLATFLAEQINEITSAFSSESATDYIRVILPEYGVESLSDIINAFFDGSFSEKILYVNRTVAEFERKPLQDIINELSKGISTILEDCERISIDTATSETKKIMSLKADLEYVEKKLLEIKNVLSSGLAGKLDKTGGNIIGNLAISGDLTVSGTTTTKNTETINVKDNIIVANSEGEGELVEDSGFAIRTNATASYGILYSPVSDGVKLGQGHLDENGKFTFGYFDENGDFIEDESQAQFVATVDWGIENGNVPKWNAEKKTFEDSGEKIETKADKSELLTIVRM